MKRLIVVGASAGGIETVRELVRLLPADFPAAIAVVIHIAAESPGILHEIFSRSGSLTAINPRDGDRLVPGRIYVAPPDFHMIVEPGRVRLTKGPRENRFRPAIDPLFRSAAQVYGPAAIGVVLTGNLDDGAAGLWVIKQLGGTAIVQDPADAMFPSMPRSAMVLVDVDLVLPLRDIAPTLTRLAAEVPQPVTNSASDMVDVEVRIAKEENPMAAGVERIGPPSPVACPECHGVLREVKEGSHVRFRCHTGHAYSLESLLAEIDGATETALWNAIRAMQEGSMLMRRVAEHAEAAQAATTSEALVARAVELDRQADALRRMVANAPS